MDAGHEVCVACGIGVLDDAACSVCAGRRGGVVLGKGSEEQVGMDEGGCSRRNGESGRICLGGELVGVGGAKKGWPGVEVLGDGIIECGSGSVMCRKLVVGLCENDNTSS